MPSVLIAFSHIVGAQPKTRAVQLLFDDIDCRVRDRIHRDLREGLPGLWRSRGHGVAEGACVRALH